MRTSFVTALDIKKKHPLGLTSITDNEYSSFANLLIRAIESVDVKDISPTLIKNIAINLTLYFEDRVADAGIFKAFNNKIREMYGKVLPFYDIVEYEYYDDEPNLKDVQLIIWYTRLCNEEEKMANPENPVIERMAELAFEVMDEHFETISINESLKDYFTECPFISDFYLMREVLKWISFDCYLTSNPNAIADLIEGADHTDSSIMPKDKTYYITECMYPFENLSGIMALPAIEWLSQILITNGKEKEAEIIKNIEIKPYGFYLVENRDKNGVSFRHTDDSTLFGAYEHINLQEDSNIPKVAITAFAKYKGDWYLNGTMLGFDNTEPFEKEKEEHKKQEKIGVPNYDKLMKLSKGSPLFYFENYDEYVKFAKEVMDIKDMDDYTDSVPAEMRKQTWTVFIPNEYEPYASMANIAHSIKDKRNPYYDKEVAEDKALMILLNVSHDLRQYLISHKMVPDACINSLKGKTRGRALIQNNMDFVARAYLREDY